MRTLQITITGKTNSDLDIALEEVTRLVADGNNLAFNRNDTGSFRFEIDGDEDLDEDEQDGEPA